MQRVLILVFTIGLLFPMAEAAPRLGSVDFARIILRSKAAFELRQKVSGMRAEAAENPRIKALQDLQTKASKLIEEGRTPGITDEKKAAVRAELQSLGAQAKDLDQEVRAFQQQVAREILEVYQTGLTSVVEDLHSQVALIAAEEEIDWLFDTSAKTNTRLPAALYIRDAKDISDLILERIEVAPEEEPADPEAAETPEEPAPEAAEGTTPEAPSPPSEETAPTPPPAETLSPTQPQETN